jgi:hypothetical protein
VTREAHTRGGGRRVWGGVARHIDSRQRLQACSQVSKIKRGAASEPRGHHMRHPRGRPRERGAGRVLELTSVSTALSPTAPRVLT